MKKTIPKNVINPFSEKFEETWALWKAYKWECFNFKYKGVISEQAALMHLVDLSEGMEEKAVKIINQSMRRQWQGFFPLHETTTPNGKSKSATGKSKPAASESLRDRVQAAVNKRYGGGGQETDESHLKAV